VTLERLWAGWRMAYIETADAEPGCVLCRIRDADDDEEALVLERTPLTYSVMNAYPYTTGHLMVVPNRHEGELDALTADEAAAVMTGTQRAVTALRSAMRCEGLNVGANIGRVAGAGVPGHVHLHALPRWGGDTNFMTSVAEARVLPEDLRTTYDKLVKVWPR